MRVVRYTPGQRSARPSVLAIGKFDGVHPGHQKIISRSMQIAQAEGMEHILCTFEPSPDLFFDRTAICLNNLRTKIFLLEKLGVTQLLLVHFRYPFCNLNYKEFIKDFLVRDLQVRHLITGKDFKFGKNREGDPVKLKEAAKEFGFSYSLIKDFPDAQARISSSQIRDLLEQGKIKQTNRLLNAPYCILARVTSGAGVGKTLFLTATANLNLKNFAPPLRGVFICRAILPNNKKYNAIANCGFKPTMHGKRLSLEAHLFGYEGSLYGQVLRLEFIDYLRAEKKFNDATSLRQQISQDKLQALARLAEI